MRQAMKFERFALSRHTPHHVLGNIGRDIQKWTLLLLVLVVSACATKETRVGENPNRRMGDMSGVVEPVAITPETVIVDARPQFEYSVSHIPKSVLLRWADFTESEPAQKGILQKDLSGLARRLARYGIAPETPVIVVGRGQDGAGEEGRIAWMLAYLGVKNVRFADIDYFKVNRTNIPDATPLSSVPVWKPNPDESLNVSRSELLAVINRRGVQNPIAWRKGAPEVLYRIIDVREESEYLGQSGSSGSVPNMDAINIPWREFFNPLLRPNPEIVAELTAVNITSEHRIIVLGHDGVSSAAVTMALRRLGYPNTGNYSGGLRDLLSAYPKK